MRVRPVVGSTAVVATSLLLAGCLASDTLIKVRADGGGTIEQTLLVNPKTFDRLAALAGGAATPDTGTAPSALPSPKDMLDEARLREAAATFGRGVRYVSSSPVKNGDLEGAKAIFAFDDINALNVPQGPAGNPGAARNPMTFALERRPTGSVLVITMKEPDTKDAAPTAGGDTAATPQLPPEAMAFIKPMLQGLHIAVAVDVEGTLIRTSADHVSGNRVTLMDLDFGALLENPAAFEKLSTLRPGTSIEDMKPLLKDLPGVKVNASPSITIEFR